MGKGDRKTKRGKIIAGSYGRLRPRKKNTVTVANNEKSEQADKA